MSYRSLLVLGVLAVAACGSSRDGDRGPGPGPMIVGEGGVPGADAGRLDPGPLPTGACEKMDILFIVDDSGSMAEEQQNLAANFPRFIQVLNDFQTAAGTSLDYRIGVTTTGKPFTTTVIVPPPFPPFPPISENGPNGALVMQGHCDMPRPWLERADPNVAQTFSCNAQVGTMGSGQEMPLQMTQRAVTDRVSSGENAGFLRPDALLAVVILTDEDDCSNRLDAIAVDLFGGSPAAAADLCNRNSPDIVPVQEIIATLDGVKGDRGRWAVAVIAGPGPGACMSAFGNADDGIRLREFVAAVGTNAVFSSICDGDLSMSLASALNTFSAACESFPPLI